jgi:hypothetical protein
MRYFDVRESKLSPPIPVCVETSSMAESISRSGLLIFWLMMSLSLLILIGAICFVLFAAEPLWSRLLTFLALGVIPSIIACGCGWAMYWILQGMSISYEPTAKLGRRIFDALANAILFFVRLSANFLLATIPVLKLAAHWLVVWLAEAGKIVQKVCDFVYCIWSRVSENSRAIIRAAGSLKHVYRGFSDGVVRTFYLAVREQRLGR